MEDTYSFFLDTWAELENLQTVKVKVNNSFRCEVKGDSVVSTLEIHVNMAQLRVSEEKVVLAQKSLLVRGINNQVEGRLSSVLVVESKVEAATSEFEVRSSCWYVADVHREEVEHGLRVRRNSSIASEEVFVRLSFEFFLKSSRLELVCEVLQLICLLCVVLVEAGISWEVENSVYEVVVLELLYLNSEGTLSSDWVSEQLGSVWGSNDRSDSESDFHYFVIK